MERLNVLHRNLVIMDKKHNGMARFTTNFWMEVLRNESKILLNKIQLQNTEEFLEAKLKCHVKLCRWSKYKNNCIFVLYFVMFDKGVKFFKGGECEKVTFHWLINKFVTLFTVYKSLLRSSNLLKFSNVSLTFC